METIYPKLVTDALKTVRYPGSGKNLLELEMVEDDIRIDGRKVSFTLIFDKPTDPFMRSVVKSAEAAVKNACGENTEVHVSTKTRTPAVEKRPVLPGVKNILAVTSGKGGVGKSTVASNLAVSLAREGYKVGLLDADIFGPSVPKMFGLEDAEIYMHEVEGQPLIIPAERYGVKILSIGFLVDKNNAVLWRGGMASNALKQLIEQADWGDLDYFVIDMPPGTSDIHLTLVQTLALTGAVVVTTPQEIALADARKGIAMFREPKINVPVLGIIDNMAWFTPEKHPDERYYIFGDDNAVEAMAKEYDVPILCRLPLVAAVGTHSDGGHPIALEESIMGMEFLHLAHQVVEAVDNRNKELPPTHKVNPK